MVTGTSEVGRQPSPIRTVRTQARNPDYRFTVHYRKEDTIIRELQATGSYDAYVFTQFERLATMFQLAPGAVCVDVGANLGLYSLYLSRKTGPTGRVIAFEGNAETCRLLKLNAAANAAANILTENRILGRHVRRVLETVNPDTGQSEFRPTSPDDPDGADAVTLDVYAGGLDRLDFVKIDVNGPDFELLLGGRDCISRHRPTLMVEFVPSQIEPEVLAECFGMLQEHDYKPWFFRGHWLSALEVCNYRMLEELHGVWSREAPLSWMNVVLAPVERTARIGHPAR